MHCQLGIKMPIYTSYNLYPNVSSDSKGWVGWVKWNHKVQKSWKVDVDNKVKTLLKFIYLTQTCNVMSKYN